MKNVLVEYWLKLASEGQKTFLLIPASKTVNTNRPDVHFATYIIKDLLKQ
jgi:hypothetical protein